MRKKRYRSDPTSTCNSYGETECCLTATCESELLELGRRVGAAFSRTPYPHYGSETALTPPIHPQDRVATARQSTRPRRSFRLWFGKPNYSYLTYIRLLFAPLTIQDEMHRQFACHPNPHSNTKQPQLIDFVVITFT